MNSIWSSEEIEILKVTYPIKSIDELTELFTSKSATQINKKAKNLKLKKDKLFIKEYRAKKSLEARTDIWSEEEKDLLIKYYPIGGAYEVKKHLPNKKTEGIKRKALRIGLKISDDGTQWDIVNIHSYEENPFVWKHTFKKRVIRDGN